jgi:hypothetical protein
MDGEGKRDRKNALVIMLMHKSCRNNFAPSLGCMARGEVVKWSRAMFMEIPFPAFLIFLQSSEIVQ